ncbi:hypothetical protein [Streptomyces shenzhenensis]
MRSPSAERVARLELVGRMRGFVRIDGFGPGQYPPTGGGGTADR